MRIPVTGWRALFLTAAGLVAAGGAARSVARDQGATVTIIHTFAGTEGAHPWGGMVQATDGNLYGTTTAGGPLANGALFRMNTAGTVTLLNYPSSAFQSVPIGDLIQAHDGFLYGTAFGPQSLQNTGGSAFRMSLGGSVTGLHNFVGNADGSHPWAGVVEGSDGNFYGTTFGGAGGPSHLGSVFRMSPAGGTTILHVFTQAEGAQPRGALVEGPDGSFYGTTTYYGTNAAGSVFKITPDGALTVLHQFTGGGGGAHPYAGLCLGTDGNFYGTTYDGGAYNLGTVFRMTPSGQLTVLHAFAGNGGGSHPYSGLIQADDGLFYGTTGGKGTSSWVEYGTVFQMTPGGEVRNLHAFNSLDGTTPIARLVQASDGHLYGSTSAGGTLPGNNAGYGTVFRVELPTPPPTVTINPSDQTVTTSQNAAFSVTATGAPSLSYRWQASVDGGTLWSDLQDSSSYSGSATAALTLLNPALSMSGCRFRAVVSNRGGASFSTAATLTVLRAPEPAMAVDTPFDHTTVAPSFAISGWAVDRAASSGTGVDTLHIWAFPAGSSAGQFVGVPTYGSPRSDIGGALGDQFTNSGFSLNASLSPGTYLLLVYSHSTVTGRFEQVIGHNITVQAPATDPFTRIDTPVFTSTRQASASFPIAGWAIDRGSTSGTGVTDIHVWAFKDGQAPGTFVCVATYGQWRPDIGTAFGHSRFSNSGYSCTVPANTFGANTSWFFVVFGNSTVTGGFTQSAGAWVTFTP
jgi:uncharacterized repeat protein (TIGR03803 family)